MVYCDFPKSRKRQPVTYKRLCLVHAFGGLHEWRDICEQAKEEGWSKEQVMSATWCHPSIFMVGFMILVVIYGIISGK